MAKRNFNRYQFYRIYVFRPESREPLALAELQVEYPYIHEFLMAHGRAEWSQRHKKYIIQRAFDAIHLMHLFSILDNTKVEDRPFWCEVRNPTGKREKRWSRINSWNSDLVARINSLYFPVNDWDTFNNTTPNEDDNNRLENTQRRRVGRPSTLRKSTQQQQQQQKEEEG